MMGTIPNRDAFHELRQSHDYQDMYGVFKERGLFPRHNTSLLESAAS